MAWVHPDTGAIQEFAVTNTLREIERMVKKIRKQAPGEIRVCYEAGVCGFVLQRQLQKLGWVCQVIAPSLVPIKPGDRVKTDRRDARKLLGQFVAGQLTEVYSFGRFASPRALMAYLGVTPSEHSSGETRRGGGITKTGNRRVRRILTETGWHSRHAPRVGKTLQARRKDQPAWAIELADRAALRRYRRYHHLLERGKPVHQAVMAVVRELVGFLWAMLRHLQPPALVPATGEGKDS